MGDVEYRPKLHIETVPLNTGGVVVFYWHTKVFASIDMRMHDSKMIGIFLFWKADSQAIANVALSNILNVSNF